jgi:DNA-directed RNA polymerase subunit beta
VLVKELQSLGLAVEAITEDGKSIKFGRDDDKANQPKIPGALLDPLSQSQVQPPQK